MNKMTKVMIAMMLLVTSTVISVKANDKLSIVDSIVVSNEQAMDGEKVDVTVYFSGLGEHQQISKDEVIELSWTQETENNATGYNKTTVLNIGGKDVGTVEITGGRGIVTFNELIETVDNVSGHFTFSLNVRNVTDTKEVDTKPISIKVGDLEKEITVTKSESGESSTFYYKTGDMSTDDTSHLRWFLLINNESEVVESDFVLEDRVQAGHELVLESFEITTSKNGGSVYSGKDGIETFNKATNSNMVVDVEEGYIKLVIPQEVISENNVNVYYKTKITDMKKADFANHSNVSYKLKGEATVSQAEHNHTIGNIARDDSIDGARTGELKVQKHVEGSEEPLQGVVFEISRHDGGLIKGKLTQQITTDELGLASIQGLTNGMYRIKEVSAPDHINFDSEIGIDFEITAADGVVLPITNTIKTKDLKVSKKWLGKSKDSVTVDLLQNDEVIDTFTLSNNNDWTAVARNLDVADAKGHYYNYKFLEHDEENYSVDYDIEGNHTIITNQFVPNIMDLEVVKKWDGKELPEVLITLEKDGEVVEQRTLSSSNNWKTVFEGLKESDENGKQYDYQILEEQYEGYTADIQRAGNVITITNALDIEKIDIPVEKVWDGLVGDDVTVRLYANGKEVENLVLSESNQWKSEFKKLDKTDKFGVPINYTVKEDKLADYKDLVEGTANSGFKITNTYVPKTVSVPVEKKWKTKIGDSVTVVLSDNNGNHYDLILNPENNWQSEFKDIPLTDKYGNILEYHLEELNQDDFIADITGSIHDGFVVLNTYDVKMTTITIHKQWIGKVGEEIYVDILQDGQLYKTVTLNKDNLWSASIPEVPITNDYGELFTYEVKEQKVDGYITSYESADYNWLVINREIVITPDMPDRPVISPNKPVINHVTKKPTNPTDSNVNAFHSFISPDTGIQGSYLFYGALVGVSLIILYRVRKKQEQ